MIDLRNCKFGDILKTRRGKEAIYKGLDEFQRHEVLVRLGGRYVAQVHFDDGVITCDGVNISDWDIVEIL